MLLSDNQLEKVRSKILESGIQNYQLQLDLIDHIACSIEEQMQNGLSFENAVELIFKSFSSRQIRIIEHTTKILTS